jgi:hypothetical protein
VVNYSNQLQILEERSGSGGAAITQFVWGLRDLDDLIERAVISGGATTKLIAVRDAMHVTAITDEGGNV